MSQVEHLGQYDSGVSYKKILFWFIVFAIIISLSSFYFILSRTVITLIPKTENKKLEIEITLNSETITFNSEKSSIRGVLLTQENSTGKAFKDIPPKKIEENAKGKVTIYNGYTRAQGFKKGEVIFVKNGNSQEKAAFTEDFVVYRSKSRTVEVMALTKGLTGHIPPSDFNFEKYDTFMNEKVTAKSDEAFSGGIRTATLVTEGDIEVSKNEIYQELINKNLDSIREKLREGEELSRKNSLSSLTFFHSDVAAPFETNNFSLELTAKTTAAVFKETDLLALIKGKLESMSEEDQEFLEYNPESLDYQLEGINNDNGSATIKVSVNGKFRPKLSSKVFNPEEIKGYNERALRAHFANFKEIESIKVDFWPSFRKTVPEMENRIIIKVEE
jgi:hypothetical protein